MATTLEELHSLLAKALKDKLLAPRTTTTDLNVVRQFLKDNGINADPGANTDLQELQSAVILPFPIPDEDEAADFTR